MKDYFTYLSLYDSSKPPQSGYNEGKKVALWTKKGKTLVTSELYAEFVNSDLKFDLVECLYDNQFSVGESKKQTKKSFERIKQSVDSFNDSETKLIKVHFRNTVYKSVIVLTFFYIFSKNVDMVMPLIAKDNTEVATELISHIKTSNYKYKSLAYYGFEIDKTSLEIKDLSRYDSTIRSLNVILMIKL
jgi:hypothetical protein